MHNLLGGTVKHLQVNHKKLMDSEKKEFDYWVGSQFLNSLELES